MMKCLFWKRRERPQIQPEDNIDVVLIPSHMKCVAKQGTVFSSFQRHASNAAGPGLESHTDTHPYKNSGSRY